MKSRALRKLGPVALAVIVIGAGGFVMVKQSPRTAHPNGPSSFAELIATPDQDLAKVDIALMNLLSAEGLPGAETLDVKQCLRVLDQWAEVVRQAERKYSPQFHRNPSRHDNSLAKFKAVNLGLTLKQDLGCDYNKDLVTSGVMADIRSREWRWDHECPRR
jgi:hypothetical protein